MVDTEPPAAGFGGAPLVPALLADRPASGDPGGERGELHTCVHAGPMFGQALPIERGETVLRDGRFAYTDFLLRDKPR